MQSEGPYISGLPDNAAVVNKKSGVAYTGLEMRSVNAVCDWMNEAHAEGRKAAEKDFKELLEIANGMRSWCDVKEGWAMIWGMQFDAWKKARGIE